MDELLLLLSLSVLLSRQVGGRIATDPVLNATVLAEGALRRLRQERRGFTPERALRAVRAFARMSVEEVLDLARRAVAANRDLAGDVAARAAHVRFLAALAGLWRRQL